MVDIARPPLPTLTETFLAHRGEAPLETGLAGALEAELRRLFDAGRIAWPGIELDPCTFVKQVAQCLPATEDSKAALSRLHGSDLYLAFACADGQPRALLEFDQRFLRKVPEFLARLKPTPAFSDEVTQLLRERLLVAPAGHRSRIAEYRGEGPLTHWLRVAALRTALNFLQSQKRGHVSFTDEGVGIEAALRDPELGYIKAHYRDTFRHALASAFATLSRRERNILRLNFVDGLNIEQIGRLYRVHRATVARWIACCRQKLLQETRCLVRKELRLAESECDSLMALVRSQLEISVTGILNRIQS